LDGCKIKKPSKCASMRGMEGVLFIVIRTFLKNDPNAVLKGCKTGTVDAKVSAFFEIAKKLIIFC
jgi:hypothetical protein